MNEQLEEHFIAEEFYSRFTLLIFWWALEWDAFYITSDVFWSSSNYVIIMDDYIKRVSSAAIMDSTESGHVNTGGTMNQTMR